MAILYAAFPARQDSRLISGDHVFTSTLPEKEITQLLADYERRGEPLPLAAEHTIHDRAATGWSPEDPSSRLSLGLLAHQAGFTQFWRQWIPHLRARIGATLAVVGRADGDGSLSWTLPLDRLEAVAVVGIVRTAAIIPAGRGVRNAIVRADGTGGRQLSPN
ncbi:hypothetical protein ABT297_23905 [Dactylosporangium sp. NPDC000555]|uniref:hypothetical protein n=1 Tax=Dactylosporangium sp. NPDC000555 TaxID=3154260 RepID=UPI00331FBA07